ncbi:MAG: hypothetical protein R2857_13190 [Vampirovibrionales bacterium]
MFVSLNTSHHTGYRTSHWGTPALPAVRRRAQDAGLNQNALKAFTSFTPFIPRFLGLDQVTFSSFPGDLTPSFKETAQELDLRLPGQVIDLIRRKSPLAQLGARLANQPSESRRRARSNRHYTPVERYTDLLKSTFGHYYKHLDARSMDRFHTLVLGQLNTLVAHDNELHFAPAIRKLFGSANIRQPQTESVVDRQSASQQLVFNPAFWSIADKLYGIAHPHDKQVAGEVLESLIADPVRLENRLPNMARFMDLLDQSRGFRNLTHTVGFTRLKLLLTMPIEDEAWNHLIEDRLQRCPKYLTLTDLNNTLTAGALAHGEMVYNHPNWWAEYEEKLLRVREGEFANAFRVPRDMAEDTFPQGLPYNLFRLHANRSQQPAIAKSNQEPLVRLMPHLLHMDLRLLKSYLNYVDTEGIGTDRWGNENELMLLFRHPEVMRNSKEAKRVCFAVTAPRQFSAHGVGQLNWGVLNTWADIAVLSHSFRSLKFDSRVGPIAYWPTSDFNRLAKDLKNA